MSKQIRIRVVRRDDIDLDRLAQALLRLAREQAAQREAQPAAEHPEAPDE